MKKLSDLSLVDTHAHLNLDDFSHDYGQAVERALDAGVGTIVNVGIDLPSNVRAIEMAAENEHMLAVVGFHPHDAAKVSRDDIKKLGELAAHPRVVAIGETGLDYYRNLSPAEDQVKVLHWQLELASELGLPVVIHCRRAERDIIPILTQWAEALNLPEGSSPGVIHCFNGDVEAAGRYVEAGFFIAFGAYIGYPSSRGLYSAIRAVPDERLLVETDAPFLPPQQYRGKRNEPAYVPLIARTLAEIRGSTAEAIGSATSANAAQVFRLSIGGNESPAGA